MTKCEAYAVFTLAHADTSLEDSIVYVDGKEVFLQEVWDIPEGCPEDKEVISILYSSDQGKTWGDLMGVEASRVSVEELRYVVNDSWRG